MNALLLAAALLVGWFIGATAVLVWQRMETGISVDARTAVVDDAAELALDDDTQTEALA